jgi:hypothetical protein
MNFAQIGPCLGDEEIHVGTVFDTDFETGCVATTEPTQWGSFNAIDSDGVECTFSLSMVTEVHDV